MLEHLISSSETPENSVNGIFEIHLTIDDPEQQEDGFLQFCKENKCKAIRIETHHSDAEKSLQFPVQLMLAKFCSGSFPEAKLIAQKLSQELQKSGMSVIRHKIEALASNQNLPTMDKDVKNLQFNPRNYFEFHAKLHVHTALTPGVSYQVLDHSLDTPLVNVLKKHRAVLSVNAYRRDQNMFTRLATLRYFNTSKNSATQLADAFLQDLADIGVEVESMEREYALYDDNPDRKSVV